MFFCHFLLVGPFVWGDGLGWGAIWGLVWDGFPSLLFFSIGGLLQDEPVLALG